MSEIINFYQCKPTSCNYKLLDIWSFSFKQLENTHNYIQWIFPLNESSVYNLKSPVLTNHDIEIFKTNPELKCNVLISVNTFMHFLHFSNQWICKSDHNHLRITRMLKCLMLLGLENEAIARLDELVFYIDRYKNYFKDPNCMNIALNFWIKAIFE